MKNTMLATAFVALALGIPTAAHSQQQGDQNQQRQQAQQRQQQAQQQGQQGQQGQQSTLAQIYEQGQGAPLHVDPLAIANIQQQLKQLGFYQQGDVDGRWDRQTQNAVREFQQHVGLPPTGDLSLSTLAALGYDLQQLTAQGLAYSRMGAPMGSFGGTGGFPQQPFGQMGGQSFGPQGFTQTPQGFAQPPYGQMGMGQAPFGQVFGQGGFGR